jgi:cobalt/nickel transport protein
MKRWWPILLVAVVLAGLSIWASTLPDGLESVAEALHFTERAAPGHASPLPDYAVPGLESSRWANALVGMLGTLLVFAIMYGLARVLARRAAVEK